MKKELKQGTVEAGKDPARRLDLLWEIVDAAVDLDDHVERAAALEKAIFDLEGLARSSPSAAVHYALGYAWYFHPQRQHSRTVWGVVEDYLGRACCECPEDPYIWLYWGHNAYEYGNYQVALDRFEHVDLARFDTRYMRLRAVEMMLCCEIMISGTESALETLERFVVLCEAGEPEDVFPTNLDQALKRRGLAVSVSAQPRMREALCRLDKAAKAGPWFADLLEGEVTDHQSKCT